MTKPEPRSVLVVQRRLTHYRMAFFEALREKMRSRNMMLRLAYGPPSSEELCKQDEGVLPWASRLSTTYFFRGAVCWQPFFALSRRSDLVVIAHENKLIFNLAQQYLMYGNRVALWGHGANLQGDSSSLKERIKRRTARQADWWFGYTYASLPHIKRSGFPSERITVLNNAIDTAAMAEQFRSVTSVALESLRAELHICGNNVGVYVGSLYEEKRIGFLLEAASAIRERFPDFEMIIAGAGPDAESVNEFCQRNDWAKYAGIRTGQRKADLLAIASVLLNPGGVGLGILDAFLGGIPIVTTDCGLHGPEIAYLRSGVNGVMTSDDLGAYVEAVVKILQDEEHRVDLSRGSASSASVYTIDEMANNFCDGAERCLAMPSYRGQK